MGGHGDVILEVGEGDYQWMNGWSWGCDTTGGGGDYQWMGGWLWRCFTTGGGGGLSVDELVVMET